MLELAPRLRADERRLVGRSELPELVSAALAELGSPGASVTYRLTTAAELRRLNRSFAGLDSATDVLAFPAAAALGDFRLPPGSERFLGDVAISVPAAQEAGADLPGGPEDELRLLAVHGLLHLLGHDHQGRAEAALMSRLTRSVLTREADRRGRPAPLVPELQPAS